MQSHRRTIYALLCVSLVLAIVATCLPTGCAHSEQGSPASLSPGQGRTTHTFCVAGPEVKP